MIVEVDTDGNTCFEKMLLRSVKLLSDEALVISTKLDQIASYLMSIDRSVFGYSERLYDLESRIEELEREVHRREEAQ